MTPNEASLCVEQEGSHASLTLKSHLGGCNEHRHHAVVAVVAVWAPRVATVAQSAVISHWHRLA